MKVFKYCLGLLILFSASSLNAISTVTVPSPLWTSYYTGAAGLDDVTNSLAIDSADNVYATGYEMTSSSPLIVTRGWVQKLSSTGTVVWTNVFSSGSSRTEGKSIAVSTITGNVYVGGSLINKSILRKYDLNGNLIWSTTVAFGAQSSINSIATVSTAIFVTGYSLAYATSTDFKMFVSQFNNNGLQLWTTYYNASPAQDIGNAITIKFGSVYVCGCSEKKALLAVFNFNGVKLSTRTYGGEGLNTDQCLGLTVDDSLAVYMVGYKEFASPRPPKQKAFIQKVGGDGVVRWSNLYTSNISLANGGLDRLSSVAVVSSNVFTTGSSVGTLTKQNIEIRLYDSNGLLDWSTSYYQVPLPARDYGTSIIASSNNFIVSGLVSNSTSTIYATDIPTSTARGTDGIIRKY